jgi:hypothetical protein
VCASRLHRLCAGARVVHERACMCVRTLSGSRRSGSV